MKRLLTLALALTLSQQARAHLDWSLCDAITSGTMTAEKFASELQKVYDHARIDPQELEQMLGTGKIFKLRETLDGNKAERAQAQQLLTKLNSVATKLGLEKQVAALLQQRSQNELPSIRARAANSQQAVAEAVEPQKIIAEISDSTRVVDMQISPDGAWLAISRSNRKMELWSLKEKNKVYLINDADGERILGFTADSQNLVHTILGRGHVHFNIKTFTHVSAQSTFMKTWAPLSLLGGAEQTSLWSIQYKTVNGEDVAIIVKRDSLDGQDVEVASLDRQIKPLSFSVSPDAHYALVGYDSGFGRSAPRVITVDLLTKSIVHELRDELSYPNSDFVRWIPGSAHRAVFLNTRNAVIVADGLIGAMNIGIGQFFSRASAFEVSPNGKWAIRASQTGQLRVLSLTEPGKGLDLTPEPTTEDETFHVSVLRFSADGQSLYSAQSVNLYTGKLRIKRWSTEWIGSELEKVP